MRRALAALLLIAGCSTGQPPAPSPAAPKPVAASACDVATDPSRPQYIVGYGSLMQDESRKRTSPQAGPAHPVEIEGYRRGWFSRGSSVGFSATFLGVVQDAESRLNAVIYKVEPQELEATDRRERSYCRARLSGSQINPLGPDFLLAPDAQVWIYVSRGPGVELASTRYPIVQSYVDVFLSGCLEQEERFGVAGFAEQCIETTSGWSEHWVNDRLYPRRPFVYQPRARDIDRLLAKELPAYFSRIRLEPGS
ncbi:MAG TPA: gamma-glutamylcyclotransferase family protein [Burkholderiales bacterium]|jgi:hypothetical protein|nr:gamma-glutamylcyclotransferase family protein [Burkholderiales bacterium]